MAASSRLVEELSRAYGFLAGCLDHASVAQPCAKWAIEAAVPGAPEKRFQPNLLIRAL